MRIFEKNRKILKYKIFAEKYNFAFLDSPYPGTASNNFKTRCSWRRISINRSGKEPYAGRIEILHIFTLLHFFGFSFCVFVVVFRLFAHSR